MKRFLPFLLLLPLLALGQTRSTINVGTSANDGTGDSLRAAMQKVNTNFYTLWEAVFTNTASAINFSTNSFTVSGNDVEVANTQYLPANRVIDGGSNTYDFTIQDTDSLSVEGVNASLTGLTALTLDGQQMLTILGRTNLYLWTPAVWAQTATTGQALILSDASDGTTEFGFIGSSVLQGGSLLRDALLKSWAASAAYTLTSATRDVDGVITTATVRWPDGATGTFTRVTKNEEFDAIDAYTITHSTSGTTVTQTAVTRDSNGAITAQPALTVTP